MKSRFVKGCLGLILLIALGGGFLYWRIRTPPKVAEDFKKLPEAEKKKRRGDAKELQDSVQDTVRKIKSGDKTPFKLVATENQLNTLLQDRINTDKFPIHDLRVGLDNEQLTLQGIAPYKGMETTVTMTGTITAENGKLNYKVDSLLLGGLLQAPHKWKK